ncbi:MAG: aromatic ring-hydroxylating dioxygenase subunit alpha [Pseudomonadota bacterium]
MRFLKNTWYVAAWAEEVSRGLFSRTLLGESVLMYRKEDGTAVAMSNRCPHRFAPLDQGQLVGDEVQCPYHGLKFDCSGKCTDNPHGAHMIPSAMALRQYPLVERHSALWIWMGEGQPDESLIPDFSVLTQPEKYRTMRRVMPIAAHYALVTDNILDLTHIVYVHAGGIGGTDLLENESSETQQVGQQVWCRRKNIGVTAAPAYRMFNPGLEGIKADKHQNIRWDPPALLLLEIVHHEHQKPESQRITNYSAQMLTPETAISTHYFWSVSRDFELDNVALDTAMVAAVEKAFSQEDKPIIEAQQKMMGAADFSALRPVLIETDAAAMRARRVLDKLLATEAA